MFVRRQTRERRALWGQQGCARLGDETLEAVFPPCFEQDPALGFASCVEQKSPKSAVGAGELGWEGDGAGGCCWYLCPPRVLGHRAARGVLTTALPGAFETPNGIRVNGVGDGTWARRQEETIP